MAANSLIMDTSCAIVAPMILGIFLGIRVEGVDNDALVNDVTGYTHATAGLGFLQCMALFLATFMTRGGRDSNSDFALKFLPIFSYYCAIAAGFVFPVLIIALNIAGAVLTKTDDIKPFCAFNIFVQFAFGIVFYTDYYGPFTTLNLMAQDRADAARFIKYNMEP